MVLQHHRTWEGSSLYYQYIKDISRYPLLSPKEERELLLRAKQNDSKAINKLVCSNLKFVINVAFLYKNQGFTLPELINEGNLGLIEAAKRFDPDKKIKFISYAVWWVRQAITRAITERGRMVRISAEKELVLKRFAKHNFPVRQRVGGGLELDTVSIAEKAGYTPKQVEKISMMATRHCSLDQPLKGEESLSIMDVVKDEKIDTPDVTVQCCSESELLHCMVKRLPPLEHKIVTLYFGLNNNARLNLEQIGEIVNLSKERVRQIKEKSLAKLREMQETSDLSLAA